MSDNTYADEERAFNLIEALDQPVDRQDTDDIDFPDPEDVRFDPPPVHEGDDAAAHALDQGATT